MGQNGSHLQSHDSAVFEPDLLLNHYKLPFLNIDDDDEIDDKLFDLIYDSIHNREEQHLNLRSIMLYMNEHKLTIDSLCTGEYIFMIILLEFLNKSLKLGYINQSHLNFIINVFKMHRSIPLVGARSLSISKKTNNSNEYEFTPMANNLICTNKVFTNIMDELYEKEHHEIIRTFSTYIKLCCNKVEIDTILID